MKFNRKLISILGLTSLFCILYLQQLRIIENSDLLRGPKFAYVFYITNSNYACSAAINAKKLKGLISPSISIVFMILDSFKLPKYVESLADELDLKIKPVPWLRPPNDSAPWYNDCMTKLNVFGLEEYDRIIYLDADTLIFKSMDLLFHLPSYPFVAPRCGWFEHLVVTSALMVIEPSRKLLQDRIISNYYDENGYVKYLSHYDMDVIHREFAGDAFLLPYYFGILDKWWENINQQISFIDRFANLTELATTVYSVHFSAGKPWEFNSADYRTRWPEAHPFFFQIWDEWYHRRDLTCGIE